MRYIGVLLVCSVILSCSKRKGYTCSSDCENITLQVNIVQQNGTGASLKVPYSIYFMKETSQWFDYPGTEYEVASGETDASGLMRKIVKVNKEELDGVKGLYIRLYPSATVHLCKNPALLMVPSVPVNNTAQFTVDAYSKKTFTINWIKQSTDVFDQTELLYGTPTLCTYGFAGERSISGNSGTSSVDALLNSYLYITIKETKLGSPNTYRWKSDSVWVDAGLSSYGVQF